MLECDFLIKALGTKLLLDKAADRCCKINARSPRYLRQKLQGQREIAISFLVKFQDKWV
jgi:hypothetical protein